MCCGSTKKLQVDHIKPWYLGGGNDPENLQALCEPCNAAKGTKEISFRTNKARQASPPATMTLLGVPQGSKTKDPAEWEMFLRKSINFFYGCAAVKHVANGQRKDRLRRWSVWLFTGNDAAWLEPHNDEMLGAIQKASDDVGYEPPDEIVFH